jgi:4-amino-4-deoxychorismate lyase
MFLVNGEWSSVISIADRSFQYGDGCFTTMLSQKGRIVHWFEHMDRMNTCLDVLHIPRPNWEQVKNWLDRANSSEDKAGLKLLITRGEGGRGYSPSRVGKPNIIISRFEFPSHYQNWAQDGIELGVCQTPLSHNPLLAGHKHNNRLEQVLLKLEIERQSKVDGVVFDIDGHVIETTMANIFWLTDNALYTPLLDRAGVSGVFRRKVLEWASKENIIVHTDRYKFDTLLCADEIFICNSILGVAPVHTIASNSYKIGDVVRHIQEMFQ